jgi:hypothetical protein
VVHVSKKKKIRSQVTSYKRERDRRPTAEENPQQTHFYSTYFFINKIKQFKNNLDQQFTTSLNPNIDHDNSY